VVLTQLGAVVHLPLNDGIGYQLHDESSNKLDAVMTITGVSHLQPAKQGYVRATLTWAGTHESKNVLGVVQRALPAEAVLRFATLKASAASTGSGATLGTSNSATRWSAAAPFTTAKKMITLSEQLPASSSGADLDLMFDPDTANYTGSIQVEVHYSVTEGAP
jgi:hypothetical protein